MSDWRTATHHYIRGYRIHRAKPISQAPPSLQLHYRVLRKNRLLRRWDVGRFGYTLPEDASNSKTRS